MAYFIVSGILLMIVGAAILYIVKKKKSGARCIGCPSGGNCRSKSSNSECCCGCHSNMKENK